MLFRQIDQLAGSHLETNLMQNGQVIIIVTINLICMTIYAKINTSLLKSLNSILVYLARQFISAGIVILLPP